jgi:hypothetical protein
LLSDCSYGVLLQSDFSPSLIVVEETHCAQTLSGALCAAGHALRRSAEDCFRSKLSAIQLLTLVNPFGPQPMEDTVGVTKLLAADVAINLESDEENSGQMLRRTTRTKRIFIDDDDDLEFNCKEDEVAGRFSEADEITVEPPLRDDWRGALRGYPAQVSRRSRCIGFYLDHIESQAMFKVHTSILKCVRR